MLSTAELAHDLSALKQQNYYEIFNITPEQLNDSPNAEKALKSRYFELAKKYHSDKCDPLAKEEADACFKIISGAYETLKDAEARSKYAVAPDWWPKQTFDYWGNSSFKSNSHNFSDKTDSNASAKQFNHELEKYYSNYKKQQDSLFQQEAEKAYELYQKNADLHYENYTTPAYSQFKLQQAELIQHQKKTIEAKYINQKNNLETLKKLGYVTTVFFGLGLLLVNHANNKLKQVEQKKQDDLNNIPKIPDKNTWLKGSEHNLQPKKTWKKNNGYNNLQAYIHYNHDQLENGTAATQEWEAAQKIEQNIAETILSWRN